MKKIILMIVCLICLCGCTNVNKASNEELIKTILDSKLKLSNQYRTGYKYYIPSNMMSKKTKEMNEILIDGKYKYYLYVDLVSYYKKTDFKYTFKSDAYLSKDLSKDKNIGYLEVNPKNDKYLIEIMYNYAKIELIVEKNDINEAVANSLIILTTIKYNDDIIENLMGEDILNFSENTFNIFDTNNEESDFLEILEEYGNYEGEDALPDYDLIN